MSGWANWAVGLVLFWVWPGLATAALAETPDQDYWRVEYNQAFTNFIGSAGFFGDTESASYVSPILPYGSTAPWLGARCVYLLEPDNSGLSDLVTAIAAYHAPDIFGGEGYIITVRFYSDPISPTALLSAAGDPQTAFNQMTEVASTVADPMNITSILFGPRSVDENGHFVGALPPSQVPFTVLIESDLEVPEPATLSLLAVGLSVVSTPRRSQCLKKKLRS